MTALQKPLANLVALSRALGKDPLLVQAGGGNVSVKLTPRRMAIKSSGFRLRHVTARQGWTLADTQKIDRGIQTLGTGRSTVRREMRYAGLLKRAAVSGHARMSMEAGFHTVLPQTYVAHVHSIGGILLGLMPALQSQQLIRRYCGPRIQIYPVPASLPGLGLTLHMQTRSRHASSGPALWIQRNHGLVWAADRPEDILRPSQDLERGLRKLFRLADYPLPHRVGGPRCREKRRVPLKKSGTAEICFCRWPACRFDFRPLFPDFAVYFDLWSRRAPDLVRIGSRGVRLSASEPKVLRDKEEILFAHALVSTIAARRHWLRPLPTTMVHAIKNLETERQRISQMNLS